ncbi:FAD-binding oxidoreductase [Streptomyces bobili]|uniref:FAD-binding oxidoreductase n=2 Tax=Streptomyces TaxID=1883 RepID=UPI00371B5591
MTVNRRSLLKLAASSTATAVSATALTGATAKAANRRSFDQLRRLLDGHLVLPREPGFPAAHHAHTLEYDAKPCQAVLLAESTADVRRALLFSQDRGMPLTVRSGGHHFQGWSTGTGMVLDVSRLHPRPVVSGPDTVHLGPGNTSVAVLEHLAPHGLVLPSGLCATVCAGGFVLGGGIGLLTPSGGMACDHLVEAEVVLADGQVVTASERDDPDLLWALRGGGGNFGVVTRLTMRPDRLSHVVMYFMAWPYTSADRVASAWQHWQEDRPNTLGGICALVRADELPGAVPLVMVMGLWTGAVGQLPLHLSELTDRAGSPPLVRLAMPMSYQEAMLNTWALDTTLPARPVTQDLLRPAALLSDLAKGLLPRPAFKMIQGRYFDRPMRDRGIDRWLTAFEADRRPGQSRISTAMRVGGQPTRTERTSTAYVHRTSSYHVDFAAQQCLSSRIENDAAAGRAWADQGVSAISPDSNGEAYVNFPEADLTEWEHAYWAENVGRLRALKRRYDPHDVFRQPQGIRA